MDPSHKVYLALDQGTHSSRAILFDQDGILLEKFQQSVDIERLDDVSVQQNAHQLLDTLRDCMESAIQTANDNQWTVVAAGMATQRSSVVAWDRKTGQALSPVLSWQDRRAWSDIELLKDIAPFIRRHSGLPLTPHYSASKVRWLRDEYLAKQDDVPKKVGLSTLSCYLTANLVTGLPFVIDHTNALRTQLLNLQTLKWDDWLVETFGLRDLTLPTCVPVLNSFGKLKHSGQDEIQLAAVSGDQTAAMYAQGPFPSETALVNLGTGAFILKPLEASAEIDTDLLGGISISDPDSQRHITEGTVNGCGAATSWAAEQLNLGDDYESMLEQWLSCVSNPPVFLNAVGGIGSPFWQSHAESKWCNQNAEPVTLPEPAAAMVAVIESIVFLIFENFQRITRYETIREIRVSGGLSALDGICHRLANLTNCRVIRASNAEATASGVAWMAAGCPKKWGIQDEETLFVPVDDRELKQRNETFVNLIRHVVDAV